MLRARNIESQVKWIGMAFLRSCHDIEEAVLVLTNRFLYYAITSIPYDKIPVRPNDKICFDSSLRITLGRLERHY